jgi:chromosome partitioning protein
MVEPVYIAADVQQRLQQIAGEGISITIIDTGTSAPRPRLRSACYLCLIPARPSVADIEAAASRSARCA